MQKRKNAKMQKTQKRKNGKTQKCNNGKTQKRNYLYRRGNEQSFEVNDVLRRLFLRQHPQELRGCPVLRREEGRGADDVLQELDGQVLEALVRLEVLGMSALVVAG